MIRSLTIAFSVAAAVAGAAAAETLTVAHGYPPTHDIVTQGIDPWMACVKKADAGVDAFNYFPSGQIASVKDSLDALNTGLTQLSTVAIGYVSNKMPLSGISMLPDMGDTSARAVSAFRKVLADDGPIAQEFAANKIHSVFINMLPVYQVISRVGPVDSLAKFRGKILRSGGGTMNLAIGAVGGSPVEMGGSDMYVAMQRGTLDAAILSLASVKPYNIQELVNAISTNATFGTFATIFVIDAAVWNKLSPKAQKAVSDCGQKVENDLAAFLDNGNEALKKQFSDLKINIYAIPDDENVKIKAALAQVSQTYVSRLAARGLAAQQVYDAYRAAVAP